MHKMAFHRGRALGIIRRTLHSSLPANAEAQAGKSQTDSRAEAQACESKIDSLAEVPAGKFNTNSQARLSIEGRCRAHFMYAGKGMQHEGALIVCSGGVLKDAILHCLLALKQPSATWPQPQCIELERCNY